MDYELQCEGFSLDEEFNDRLLLCGRKFVLEMGESHPVRIGVKLIDGLVQARVEILLPTRRVSAIVRRKDPVQAMQCAVDALRDAVMNEVSYGATGS